jgi:hypothetical protein
MSGPPDYSQNPFLPAPQPGFIPAPDPGGFLAGARQGDPYQDGILLSPEEQAALAAAPRAAPGTDIAVRAKPVFPLLEQLPPPLQLPEFLRPQHMFETFDDGRDRYIFRGGPQGPLLHAQVDPATQSPDYEANSRVLFARRLPGRTASEAVAPARQDAAQINASGSPYGIVTSNSNSVIGDFTNRQYGKRVGDWRTPGYRTGFAPPFVPYSPVWP